MLSPLISAIIPTYNRYDFLIEAIRSVKNQTYPDIELIIVDDGSTDQSACLADNMNLKYVYQENKGPASARNSGAAIAKGEWLAFLDSDDLWHENKIEKQLDLVKHNPEYRIFYSDELWIRNGVPVNKKKKHRKYSDWIYPFCLPLCIVGASTVLIHHSLWNEIGGMDESMPVAEDYDLWLRLAARNMFYYINEKLITKRGGRDDQLSISVRGIDKFRILALRKMLTDPTLRNDWREMTRVELIKKCKIYMAGCKKYGRMEDVELMNALLKEYDS